MSLGRALSVEFKSPPQVSSTEPRVPGKITIEDTETGVKREVPTSLELLTFFISPG